VTTHAEIVKHHVESLVNGEVDEVISDFAAVAARGTPIRPAASSCTTA
jgi:hypothetical protein